jgi:hypothetical protein
MCMKLDALALNIHYVNRAILGSTAVITCYQCRYKIVFVLTNSSDFHITAFENLINLANLCPSLVKKATSNILKTTLRLR